MNAKKAKELRRSLRKGGVDCTEAKHVQSMYKCGRAIYQQLKRKV